MGTLKQALKRQERAFRSRTKPPKINKETVPSLPNLARMARLGLLTFDSQEGRICGKSMFPLNKEKWEKAGERIDGERDDAPPLESRLPERWRRRMRDIYAELGGSWGRGSLMERAYVEGFAEPCLAENLVQSFNMYSDMTAWIVLESKESIGIPVTWTTFDKIGGRRAETWLHTTFTRKLIKAIKAESGLDADEPASLVVFMDPKVGRKARSKGGLHEKILNALGGRAVPPGEKIDALGSRYRSRR